jgi:hypothetical protein
MLYASSLLWKHTNEQVKKCRLKGNDGRHLGTKKDLTWLWRYPDCSGVFTDSIERERISQHFASLQGKITLLVVFWEEWCVL